MRTPINTGILRIQVERRCKEPPYLARAENVEIRPATATGSPSRAALNLALRWFFGGNTRAFVGKEEHAAVVLTGAGYHFIAVLKAEAGCPAPK